jgi:ammonium transporter, Amt family
VSGVSAGDTGWVLVSSALVLLMLPGLALFYGGLVRSRSMLNTMMMCVAALGVVGVQWVVVGYSLAFAPGSGWLGGLGWVGLSGVGVEPGPYAETIPHFAFVAFQGMFAMITVALIAGALVERMRFRAFLLFGVLWATVVYAPVAHWVWGEGGWLGELGALDFAGGTVVHVNAGVAALVAAAMLGRRHGHGRAAFVPHNVPLTLLGAGLLWVGWFGFNAGSALAADGVAATAFMATFAAPAAGLTTWLLVESWRTGKATAVGAATGVVVGLVAITPAAGFVTPAAALGIGALAALAGHAAIQLRARLKVDDSLDVFACHGVAGITGAVLTGVFATTAVNPDGADGLLAGDPGLVLIQLVAVAATMVFAAAGTAAVVGMVRVLAELRVPLADELLGIDLAEHGELAYHGGGEPGGVPALAARRVDDSVVLPAGDVLVRDPLAAPGV